MWKCLNRGMGMLWICIAWYLIGLTSFVFWWTTDEDLTIASLLFGCLVALSGPVAFAVGAVIHGRNGGAVLLKRRK